MSRYARKIECVRTTLIGGRRHITEIGGSDGHGQRWSLPGYEALMEIESGRSTFFMDYGGQSLLVTIGIDAQGEKCLSAFGASLFDLPECPE